MSKEKCSLWNFQEFLSFLIGFVIGYLIIFMIASNFSFKSKQKHVNEVIREQFQVHQIFKNGSPVLYDQELADKLYNEVRILCWVFTHPDNHKVKVPHVRASWAKKCNKLIFFSVKEEPGQPDIIALPIEDGRSHLWKKTKLAMKYVYDNHINDAEWFMRADDDKYVNYFNFLCKFKANY